MKWQAIRTIGYEPDHLDKLTKYMDIRPVGFALSGFRKRYADLATEWVTKEAQMAKGIEVSPSTQLGVRRAVLDARNYVIVVDPAARLVLDS